MTQQDYIIVEADTYEEAVSRALKMLDKSAEEVEIEVLEQPRKILNVTVRPCKIMVKIRSIDNKPESIDGSFVLEYKEDGVYLTVNGPVGNGKPVDERVLIDKIKRKNIEQIDNKAVFLAIYTADGIPVKIAPPQSEHPVDAEVDISISRDAMEAYMCIFPEDGGKPCDMDMVRNAIDKAGIKYGINWDAIESALQQGLFNQNILIAKGNEPINGQNGYIEYTVQLDADAKPRILEDGTVDYKHLDLIKNVRKGDVLARRIPPTSGTAGRTVLDKEIPAKDGKPVNLLGGKNTAISEDGDTLIASIDGQVVIRDGKISVLPVYEVPADVDNSIGDIEFVGNVKIKGNVRTGFSIKAAGDVEVMGVVEGATIISDGSIVLRSGVQGMNKAVLEAGADIIARFVENAHLEAGHDVVADAIMHSYIKAGNSVTADGRRGLIVGGNIKAAMAINARNIGSFMATATELEVGIDPGLRERYNQISVKLEEMDRQLKNYDKDIQTLTKMETRGGLPADRQHLKIARIQNKIKLVQEIAEYKTQLIELEEQMEQLSNGTVNVKDTIFPGVKITIGSSVLNIMKEFHYATFKREHGEVVMVAYEKKGG
ncbi:FapA family protein [Mahella sp.]|uniref:FapA family protein n=1 Tax=Mahella sp. TaxID=2798721 RepID=UPI0025BF72AA|nr:FapA family protein [Mahella sp.]MBZ4665486.1 hypothetical protein [Mahella sp.]